MINKNIFTVLTLMTLLSAPTALAATLSLQNKTDIIQVGDIVEVKVLLDTEGASVNAIESSISYSKDELTFLKVRDGDSNNNFWGDKPTLKQEGQIVFSGIIPGGLSSSEVQVVTLVFEAKKEGVGKVLFDSVQVLLNDGLGTPAELRTIPLERNVQGQSVASPLMTEYIDTEPPEVFSPVITYDPDIFDGRKFLVFSTQDKSSGIDFYEVKEGVFNRYEVATSPYEIKDQSLSDEIFVRAVDRAGNEYVAIIYPQTSVPWYQFTPMKAVILIVCLALLFFLSRRLFAR